MIVDEKKDTPGSKWKIMSKAKDPTGISEFDVLVERWSGAQELPKKVLTKLKRWQADRKNNDYGNGLRK